MKKNEPEFFPFAHGWLPRHATIATSFKVGTMYCPLSKTTPIFAQQAKGYSSTRTDSCRLLGREARSSYAGISRSPDVISASQTARLMNEGVVPGGVEADRPRCTSKPDRVLGARGEPGREQVAGERLREKSRAPLGLDHGHRMYSFPRATQRGDRLFSSALVPSADLS